MPTIENVHNAMKSHNLYNVVFQSASMGAGKLRLIYKRSFMLYLDGVYSEATDTWELASNTKRSSKIRCDNNSFPLHYFSASLPKAINEILLQELRYISNILAERGINTSKVDTSAPQSHMHSAHCINTEIPHTYELPMFYLEGETL